MQAYTLNTLPVYLPYDIAHAPFGDPFNDVTITSSIPGQLVTVPGYEATSGDIVFFSVNSGNTIATNVSANFIYYVTSVNNNSFYLALTKGGAIVTSAVGVNATSGQVVIHLVSGQVDGALIPFKPGNSVVAINTSNSAVWIFGAADNYAQAPGSVAALGSSVPGGPGALTNLLTGVPGGGIPARGAAVITLDYDWIAVGSAAGATSVILLQN